MNELNNNDDMQQAKDEFKIWLKKLHEQLTIKNQALKTQLSLKQQTIKEIKNSIEKHSNDSLNNSSLTIDVLPNKVQLQLEEGVNQFKIRSEQFNECCETIKAKVEDRTKEMHNKFFEIITKDDIALKPFHEVEDAITDLNLKIDCCKREQNENQENFVKKLKEREDYFNDTQQSILTLEPIVKEMRCAIENSNKKLDAMLKLHKLKSVEEANEESNESKELLSEISNLKSQLENK